MGKAPCVGVCVVYARSTVVTVDCLVANHSEHFIVRRILLFMVALVLPTICLASIASGQTVTDKLGFIWDLSPSGSVEDGSDDAFDGAVLLVMDSGQFNGSGGSSNKDGLIVFGPEQIGGVTVTREVLMVADPPGLVYADSYRNNGNDTIQFSPSIHSDFGEAAVPQTKNSAEGGMTRLIYTHDPGRPTIVFLFGGEKTNFLPTLAGNGDTYTFQFPQVELHAGETKSIGYFVGQRTPQAGRVLYRETDAFERSMAGIHKLRNYLFLNIPGFGIYQTGDLGLKDQGSMDFIATRKKDEVYGKLLTREFSLDTDLGKRKYQAEEIVNAIRVDSGRFKVAANDGSVLEGQFEPDAIKFELSDGGQGEIETQQVTWLVPKLVGKFNKKEARLGKWFDFSSPIFVFASQDRLTGVPVSKTLNVHTEIGTLEVPVDLIRAIKLPTGNGDQQARFTTTDGQSFTGFLYDDIEVEIFDGSVKKVSPKNVTDIYLSGEAPPRSSVLPSDRPYLKLSDRDLLYVDFQVDQKPLEFKTAFGTRAINPEQILMLTSTPGLTGGMNITLWDGSKLSGSLTSEDFMIKVLGQNKAVLAPMIRKFHNPMALPPEGIRQQYIKLIQQLGSKEYGERADAVRLLEKDAVKIRGLLKSQLELVDVEARARIWKLLPESDRPKKAKKPKQEKKETTPEPDEPDEPE